MNSEIRTTESAEMVKSVPPSTAARSIRPRHMKLAGLAFVAVLGVSACSSDPSAFRVAQDIINTLADTDAERDCMLDKLDEYGEDEIASIARSVDEVGPGTPLDQFEADLASCR